MPDNVTTPLLPAPSPASRPDSHPIYLRACHSPWRTLSQKTLTTVRSLITAYLISVLGVALKYKLNSGDGHTGWRIPFQFSSVSFALLLLYNVQVTVWTFMHTFFPRDTQEAESENCTGQRLRVSIIKFLSPSNVGDWVHHTFAYSLFYTTVHVFTFMNTVIYWGVLAPTGHGGFQPPNFNHPQHKNQTANVMYDSDKGLFEEGKVKSFSIINVWTITSVIAVVEILALNSIRRPTPVVGHIGGVMLASTMYLAWAFFGRLMTGHSGLFFLDPKLMGGLHEAVIAACFAFVSLAPGMFAYMNGLIAMRESLTAAQHEHS